MESEPRDPLSTLSAGAIALHELFESLKTAGFSEEQALDLVARVMLNPGEGTP